MVQRVATALLLTVVVAAASSALVSAQAAPNPTQQTVATPRGDIPLFRVTVVGRTVSAINYRPRSGDTRIDFGGTVLMHQSFRGLNGRLGRIVVGFFVGSHFSCLSGLNFFASFDPLCRLFRILNDFFCFLVRYPCHFDQFGWIAE